MHYGFDSLFNSLKDSIFLNLYDSCKMYFLLYSIEIILSITKYISLDPQNEYV